MCALQVNRFGERECAFARKQIFSRRLLLRLDSTRLSLSLSFSIHCLQESVRTFTLFLSLFLDTVRQCTAACSSWEVEYTVEGKSLSITHTCAHTWRAFPSYRSDAKMDKDSRRERGLAHSYAQPRNQPASQPTNSIRFGHYWDGVSSLSRQKEPHARIHTHTRLLVCAQKSRGEKQASY